MTIPKSGEHFTMKLWLAISLYLLVNAVSQLLVSGTADLDQAEQLVLSQTWDLGYGPQPPLYTYIVKLVFLITGPALWPLRGLKVLLLSVLVGVLLKIGEQLGFRRNQQVLMLCGLALIPQIIWEAQRDLTHSVLATVMAASTLLQMLRLIRHPNGWNHALLGGVMAAGLLSKYTVVIFDAGLFLTALSIPKARTALLRPPLLAAATVLVLVLAPHGSWLLSHSDLALAGMQKSQPGNALLQGGVIDAVVAAIAFLTPFWLGALALLWANRSNLTQADARYDTAKTMLQRLPAMVFGVLLVIVLSTGATNIKDRWYQSLLFFTPISVVSLLPPLKAQQFRWAVRVGIAAAGSAALLLPGRTLLAGSTGVVSRPNYPLPQLIKSLEQGHGTPELVLASTNLIGGNVRKVLPSVPVLTPKALGQGAALLAQRARKGSRVLILREHNTNPTQLASLVQRVTGTTPKTWQTLKQPMIWRSQQSYGIDYAWITVAQKPRSGTL